MLAVIRGKHSKKILWVVAIVIIVAFVFSGAQSFLQQRAASVVAKIGNRKVSIPDFKYYIDLARLNSVLYASLEDNSKTITSEEIMEKAKIYFRLIWKAGEEKIEVNDKDIINWINQNFSRNGNFDKAFYERYIKHLSRSFNLNLTPRSFEEYIRKFIMMDKLWEKSLHVIVSDEEVQALYETDTQTAKIAYLFIPYEKFRVDVGISPKEIEEFYENNKSLFKKEPKVNIQYIVFDEDNQIDDRELSELAKIKTLDKLHEYISRQKHLSKQEFLNKQEQLNKEEKTSLEIKETGFIGMNDPVGKIGWHPTINQKAFSLAINQISEPIKLKNGFIIISKKDEKPAFIPALGEVKSEVEKKLITSQAKEETKKFAREILDEINKKEIKDLNKLANKKNIEFKETPYFKHNDYIEGLGLNRMVSTIIFSLKKDEVHSEITALDKGVYILQLKDKTPIDKSDFQAKRKDYYDKIEERKLFIERLRFITKLNQEIIINIPIK